MKKEKYNNQIYTMYEEEVLKNEKANKEIKYLKLEIYTLKTELNIALNKIDSSVEIATKPLINETNKLNYKLSCNIKFKGNIFNALSYTEIQNNKEVTFNYITNLKVTNYNIESVVAMGRRRWKIENEGFNEQKNGTYCISHLCSRNENALRIHYHFIQFAHIIRQLLEYGSKLLKDMNLKTKKEVSSYISNNLTSEQNSDLNNLETNFQLRFDD